MKLSGVPLFVTTCLVVLVSTNGAIQQQPNILLLLTDDQDLILGGADHMPYLDELLTQQGTTFRNFFVHTPTCCPSRSSILSGRYLHNIGVLNNSLEGNCDGPAWQKEVENFTYAVYAKRAGYQTGYAGKYLNTYGHNESNRVPPGWDKWLTIVGNSQYYDYNVVVSDNGGIDTNRYRHGRNYSTDYFSDVVANRTLKMIREFTSSRSSNRPFLIVNAWPAPHDPIIPAPWAWNWFSDLKAPRTPNWNASEVYQHSKHWIVREQEPINANFEALIDRVHSTRLETLLSVDHHIKQFVQLLEKQGVLDNTIIMYTSDNGFQLGQHRLTHEKYHLYENDIRVPFVVRGPNIPKNFSVYDIALNIDIAPTIHQLIQNSAAIKSVPIPETMDGMPFLPIVAAGRRSKSQRRDDFLVSYHGEGVLPCGLGSCISRKNESLYLGVDSINNTYNCLRSIVLSNRTDFVYCRFSDAENFVEYYDLNIDPWQLNNKAFDLTQRQIRRLDERLTKLRLCSGSSCRSKQQASFVDLRNASFIEPHKSSNLGQSRNDSKPIARPGVSKPSSVSRTSTKPDFSKPSRKPFKKHIASKPSTKPEVQPSISPPSFKPSTRANLSKPALKPSRKPVHKPKIRRPILKPSTRTSLFPH